MSRQSSGEKKSLRNEEVFPLRGVSTLRKNSVEVTDSQFQNSGETEARDVAIEKQSPIHEFKHLDEKNALTADKRQKTPALSQLLTNRNLDEAGKAVFQNKYDMLDQFSRAQVSGKADLYSKRSEPHSYQQYDSGRPANSPSKRSSGHQNRSSIVQLEDLQDVFDFKKEIKLRKLAQKAPSPHQQVQTHIQGTTDLQANALFRTSLEKATQLGQQRIKSQQKSRRQNYVQAEGVFTVNIETPQQFHVIKAPNHSSKTQKSHNDHLCQRRLKPSSKRKSSLSKRLSGSTRKEKSLEYDTSSQENTFRKIIDLNQQVADSDQSGVLTQLRFMDRSPKFSRESRPETVNGRSSLIFPPEKRPILRKRIAKVLSFEQVRGKAKRSATDDKNILQLKVVSTRFTNQSSIAVHEKQTSGLQKRVNDVAQHSQQTTSQVASGAHKSVVKRGVLNLSLSKQREGKVESCKQQAGEVRTEKNRAEDQYLQCVETQTDKIKRKMQQAEFIVKSFQNSLESKAQREARLSGFVQNPYVQQQQSRKKTFNIIINPFERKKTKKGSRIYRGNRIKTSMDENEMEPHTSLLRSDHCEQISPKRLRASSINDSIVRSTTFVQGSSLNASECPDTLHAEIQHTQTNLEYGAAANYPYKNLAAEYQVKDRSVCHQDSLRKNSNQRFDLDSHLLTHTEEKIGNTWTQSSQLEPVRRSDERELKHHQQMLREKAKLKKRVQDTQTLVCEPEKSVPGQGDFSVQNIVLHQRSRHKTAVNRPQAVTRGSQITVGVQPLASDESIAELSQRHLMGELGRKKPRTASSMCLMKQSAVQRHNLRKRIEASKKFGQEYNDAISIRPTTLMPFKNTKKTQKMTLFVSSYDRSMRDLCVDEKDKSIDALKKVERHSLTRSQLVSAPSSQVLTPQEKQMSWHREQTTNTMVRSSIDAITFQGSEDLVAQNCFGVRRQVTQKQMMYLRNATKKRVEDVCVKARNNNNSLGERQTLSATLVGQSSLCSCAPGGKHSAKRSKEQDTLQLSNEFVLDLANPYNLTDKERAMIKEKNQDLISHFCSQQLPSELKCGPAYKSIELSKKRRVSVESTGTLYQNKGVPTILNYLTPGQRVSRDPEAQSSYGNTDHNEAIKPENSSNTCCEVTPVNELNEEKHRTKLTSLNSNECDDLGPIVQPVNPKGNHVGTQDDFETDQMSSTGRERGPVARRNRLLKERPASSCDGSKALRKLKEVAEPKGKTRVISKGTNSLFGPEKHSQEKNNAQHCYGRTVAAIDQQTATANEYLSLTHDIVQQRRHTHDGVEKQTIFRSTNTRNNEVISVKEETLRPVQASSYKALNLFENIKGVNPDLVLAMSPSEINKLSFKEVCAHQQALYAAMTQVQVQLSNAIVARQQNRALSLNNDNSTYQQGGNTQTQLSSRSKETNLLKSRLYNTNYEGNLQQKGPSTRAYTPHTLLLEAKKMPSRKKVKEGVELGKDVKIKLVTEPVAVLDKIQVEINGYFKFKRKQERIKRRGEQMERQKEILRQCSLEEVLLLSKINRFFKQQSLLVERAKFCTLNEFLNPNSGEIKAASQVVEEMEENHSKLMRIHIEGIIDNKHMPSAQRLSSRQSLHKINRTGDTSQAQSLIKAAHRQLNSINRKTSALTRSNKSRQNGVPETDRLRSKSGLSQRSFQKSSFAETNAKLQFQESKIGPFSNETQEGPAIRTTEPNKSGEKTNVLIGEEFNMNQLASTINLYLQKFSAEDKPTADLAATQVLSQDKGMEFDIQTRQLQLMTQTELRSSQFGLEKATVSGKYEMLEKDSRDQMVDVGNGNIQGSKSSSLDSVSASPVDKFGLVHRSQNNLRLARACVRPQSNMSKQRNLQASKSSSQESVKSCSENQSTPLRNQMRFKTRSDGGAISGAPSAKKLNLDM